MKIGIVGHGAIVRQLGHQTIVYDPANQSDVRFEREVYDKADAVVLSTPSYCHEAGLRACVERGKHVLIGKPLWAHFTCAQPSSKALYLSDGVILSSGAHEVDLALHLFGSGRVSS